MDTIVPIILDIIVLFFLVFFTYRGYRNGFLKTIVQFLGYFIALFVSFWFSRILAGGVAQLFHGSMYSYVQEKVGETVSTDFTGAVAAFFQNIPKFLSGCIQYLIGDQAQVAGEINGLSSDISTSITDSVLMPIVTLLLQGILFLLLFGVCMFLVRRLAGLFGGFYKIPLIGSINSLLGGILGCFQSLLFLLILSSVISVLIMLSGNANSILNTTVIDQSYAFKSLYAINPFIIR